MRAEKWEELNRYIDKIKTIEMSEPFESTGFIKIKNFMIKLNNGREIERERIYKNNSIGDGVSVLPYTKNGTILLVVQPRVFTKLTVGIEAPAGYIDKGEEPIEAAKRELREETGYTSENLEKIASYHQDIGSSGGLQTVFLATGCEKVTGQELDDMEYVEIFECTLEEAEELFEKDYIKDPNTIILLEALKKKLNNQR